MHYMCTGIKSSLAGTGFTNMQAEEALDSAEVVLTLFLHMESPAFPGLKIPIWHH